MPINITEVEAWTKPVKGPADADPADREWINRNAASIAQGLANRTNVLASTRGFIAHGGFYRESITEVGWGALVFGSAGELVTLAAGTADFGTPAANTWYYVYAFNAGGGPPGSAQIERDTIPPDPTTGYRTKTGEPHKLLVGCVFSDASSEYLAFRMKNGRYVYQRSAMSSVWDGVFQPLVTTTSGGTWETLPLQLAVPPHVRLVTLRATLIWHDPANFGQIKIRTKGDTTSSTFMAAVRPCSTDVQADESIDFVTNGAQEIEYQVLTYVGDTVTSTAQIEVIGFQE